MRSQSPDPAAARIVLQFQSVMAEFLAVQQDVVLASVAASLPAVSSEGVRRDTPAPALQGDASVPPPPYAEPAAERAPVLPPGPMAVVPSGAELAPMPALAAAATSNAPAAAWQVAEPAPADDASALRLTVSAIERPWAGPTLSLAPDTCILVTSDGHGVATELTARLRREGYRVALVSPHGEPDPDGIVYRSALDSPGEVERLLSVVSADCGPVGALVHLLPLAPALAWDQLDLDGWMQRLAIETRSLFLLARALRPALESAATNGGAAVIAATALGGAFASGGVVPPAGWFPGQGGVTGFLKCLAVEWPTVRVRTVDLNSSEPPAALSAHVLAELWSADSEPEVGYAGGRRLGLAAIAAPAVTAVDFTLPSDSVILATGGARGITAEICLDLAWRCQPTFVLVGNSPLAEAAEGPETSGLTDAAHLKRALMETLARDGTRVTVPMVEKAYGTLMKRREIQQTIGGLTAAGARVHYVALDVRDVDAFGALIDDIYQTYGRLDGVIHGAGIIEDKLVHQKPVESFDRVFGTKTASAFVLARKLRPESLRFAVFFTSVAGRFGNRGQADYAAANEVVNKLAVFLDHRWPARVCALNWAPWDKRGMVSPELRREFQERGVELLRPAAGCRAFWEEIQQPQPAPAEIVVAGSSRLELSRRAAAPPTATPLLHHATRTTGRGATIEYARLLDVAVDRYLMDHRLDGRPVLPLAMATELMAEAAQATWPDLTVTAVRNLQLLKGVVLDDGPVPIVVTVRPPVHGDGLVTEAEVDIITPGTVPQKRYRAVVELSAQPPGPTLVAAPAQHLEPIGCSMAEAYRRWTFHGPLFQRITGLDGIGAGAVRGQVLSPSDAPALAGVTRAGWLIDPFVFDSALQMVLMWSRVRNDKTALPTRLEAFRCFGSLSDAPLTCVVRIESTAGGHALKFDVDFLDAAGRLIAALEGMEASCSAALNRLAVQDAAAEGPSR